MRLPKLSLKLFKKLWPKRRNSDNNTDIVSSGTPIEGESSPPSGKSGKSKSTTKTTPPSSSQAPPPEECPICHDPVGIANPEGVVESWTKLHCGHRFGTKCIQTWLEESIERDQNTNPTCPICRSTAKHPCGHLVSPPPFPAVLFNNAAYNSQYEEDAFYWLQPRQPPQPPPIPRPMYRARHYRRSDFYDTPPFNQRNRENANVNPSVNPSANPNGRRARRRLTRRPGHPLNPVSMALPPTRQVHTVGECATCIENAAFEARMKRIAETRRRLTADSMMSSTDSNAGNGNGSGSGGGGGSSGRAAAIKSIIPGLKKRSSNTVHSTPAVDGPSWDPGSSRDRQLWRSSHIEGPVAPGMSASRVHPRSLTPVPGSNRRLSI